MCECEVEVELRETKKMSESVRHGSVLRALEKSLER